MDNHVKVTSTSEIQEAVKLAEIVAGASKKSDVQVCQLICEELLVRLLNMGCTEINVSIKGFMFKYLEFRTPGKRADVFGTRPASGEEGIGDQIAGCLLEQYADYIIFLDRNNGSVYKLYAGKQNTMDLKDEIFAFYNNADPENPPKTMDVLWHIAGNHKGFFAFSVFILLLKHLGALMLPVFVANIIDIVTQTGSFFVWPVMMNLLMSVISLTINLVCYWIDSRCYRRFAREVEAGFRMALVQKLQVLSMRYHQTMQSGVVLSKVVSDVQFIQMLIYDRFMEVLYLFEDALFIIIVAMMKFPLILAFYFIIVPAVVILLHRFTKVLQDRRAAMRQENEQVNSAVKEMIEMDGLTRAQGLAQMEYRNILRKVRSAQRASVQYDRQTVTVNNITYGGFQGLRLVSLSLTAMLTAGGYINVGTLVLFQSIFDLIINNVQRILDSLPLITQGYDSLVSVNEILLEQDVEQNGRNQLPSPVRGEIEFRDVTFGYEDARRPVLDQISFKVPSGGNAAFVGKSGEGKSTLLNLILGYFKVQDGEILIDGMNLNELDKTAYRHNIAVVTQNTVLFSGTLWDNLIFGQYYVTADKVMDVIRRVGLEDLLETLPDGLNSQIYENGSNLSGGQRQRIAIARALLRDPKIILLDEATSALDRYSEEQVQKAIDAIMGCCTVIMVAHRLETLRRVDTVYRLNDGDLKRYESFEEYMNDLEDFEA